MRNLLIESIHCDSKRLVVYGTAPIFWSWHQHSGLSRVCVAQCAEGRDHRDRRERLQDACYLHFENQIDK